MTRQLKLMLILVISVFAFLAADTAISQERKGNSPIRWVSRPLGKDIIWKYCDRLFKENKLPKGYSGEDCTAEALRRKRITAEGAKLLGPESKVELPLPEIQEEDLERQVAQVPTPEPRSRAVATAKLDEDLSRRIANLEALVAEVNTRSPTQENPERARLMGELRENVTALREKVFAEMNRMRDGIDALQARVAAIEGGQNVVRAQPYTARDQSTRRGMIMAFTVMGLLAVIVAVMAGLRRLLSTKRRMPEAQVILPENLTERLSRLKTLEYFIEEVRVDGTRYFLEFARSFKNKILIDGLGGDVKQSVSERKVVDAIMKAVRRGQITGISVSTANSS